jgi:hypothetical protein
MDEPKRIDRQREMLRAFKEGISTTFQREITYKISLSHILNQDLSFIAQYGIFRVLMYLLL